MIRILDYFFASRPLLHLPIWSIYIVSANAVAASTWSWRDLIMLMALGLAAAGAYYLNQVYDYQSDRINDKIGFLQHGLIHPDHMLLLYIICSLAAVALSTTVSFRATTLISIQVILGYLYSAPLFRFKDRPALGVLVNATAFGVIIPLCGSVGQDSPSNNGVVSRMLYFGLSVAAIHVMTAIPDRLGDAATGKRTVPVVAGPTVAKLTAAALLVGAAMVYWGTESVLLVTIAALSAVLALLSTWWKGEKPVLFAAKMPLVLLSLLAAYYCWWYLIIVVAIVIISRVYYRRRFNRTYPSLS
jgi:4-hydroxybenzoate polyprenyltransferase